MKKVLHDFLLLSLAIGCFFCSHAMAGEITLPLTDSTTYFDSEQEEYFATSAKYTLLQDGDIIHFLLNQELLGTSVEPFATFSATCYMIDEHGELTICTEHCSDFFSQIPPYKCTDSFNWPYFITRSAQNKTFLLHMNGDVYQWCPNGPDAWQHITALDLHGINTSLTFEADWQDFISFSYAVWEDTLYASYKNVGDGYTIYAFDLMDGSRHELCQVGQIYSMSAGKGFLLACASEKTTGLLWYYLIDCSTGEKTKFVMGLADPQYSDLIYDRENGWYYVSRAGSICHLASDGKESIVASFSMSADGSGCDLAMSADGSQMLLLDKSYGGGTIFRTIELTPQITASLTFEGWTSALNSGFGTLPDFSGFAMDHGQVQCVIRSSLSEGRDVAQALLTENDSFDILVMNTAVMDLESLYSKGFFVELTSDDAITAYFSQLYPAWCNACMWQGEIAAFPLQADDRYQFMYNTDLWLELGLTVPQTYDQLFQCIQQLHEDGILDEYPLFDCNGSNSRSYEHLFYKLLGDYILRCELHGQVADFRDPLLLKLLCELDMLRSLLDEHDSMNLAGIPLLASRGGVTAVNFDHIYETYGCYVPLMLGFTETEDPIMQTSMIVMIVNPNGKNIELAKDYLSYLATKSTPVTQCVFLQGMPNGIETEQSIKENAEWMVEYEACERLLQEAQDNGDAKAIEAAKQTQAALILREPETQWVVTPAHAMSLYQALPYAQVIQYYPYTIVLENGEQLLERYLGGQIDVDELLRSLSALVMTIEAE